MDSPFCFDCRYFVPEGKLHNDLTEDQWDEIITGDCRRHCPVAIEPSDDVRRVNYAYWPIVLAGEWCGEFQPKRCAELRQAASLMITSTRESNHGQ